MKHDIRSLKLIVVLEKYTIQFFQLSIPLPRQKNTDNDAKNHELHQVLNKTT